MKSITQLQNAQRSGFFVVGTDTGVGKTTFTRGLLRALRGNGHQPVPYKPVETGVGEPEATDAAALARAAQTPLHLRQICPFSFPLPVAPVVAAAEQGIALSVRALLNATPPGSPLVVESAGGLLSPLSARQTNADVAEAFGLPVILVARNSLGTINHCALALAELRRRQLPVFALVLVNVAPPGPDGGTNARCIEDLCGLRPRLTLPFAPTATDDDLASFVADAGPWL